MKSKYMLGIFLILLMATTACVYAADAKIDDDYKFTLPDKYTVTDQINDGVHLQIDDDHVISVIVHEGKTITDSMIKSVVKNLESQGYNVTDNHTFQYNGKDIVEIDYENDHGRFYSYTWQVDDDDYVVANYGHNINETAVKWDNSPVKEIFDTFAKT